MRYVTWRVAFLCLVIAVPGRGSAQEKFFDSKGVQIHYTERGRGEVIVLIHGNGGSLQGWIDSGVLPNLAKNYRVVAFDVRGHGKSGKPHDVRAYGSEMGLDVVRLLDHLGVRRAHIVGYSMGASITAHLLTLHPDRFITATLGGAPGRFKWTAEDTARTEQEASEKEKECVSRTQIRRLAPPNQPKPTEEDIRKQSAACMANTAQDRFALAALHRSFAAQAITPEQVRATKVPTLAVVGSLDPYVTSFQELKQLRPDMTLIVVDGATHGGEGGAMRRPEFVDAVRSFIASGRRGSETK